MRQIVVAGLEHPLTRSNGGGGGGGSSMLFVATPRVWVIVYP